MMSFSATSSRGWNWLETCDDDDNNDNDNGGEHRHDWRETVSHHRESRRKKSRALTLLEDVILPAVGSCCYTRSSPHQPSPLTHPHPPLLLNSMY